MYVRLSDFAIIHFGTSYLVTIIYCGYFATSILIDFLIAANRSNYLVFFHFVST